MFVFGDFNICHKDELTYSGETDRWLLRCLTFLFGLCDSHNPTLLDLFISSDSSICSTMDFPPLGNSDHAVVSVSIDFS